MNIAKFRPIVILALLCAFLPACASVARQPASEPRTVSYEPPATLGSIGLKEIDEASGIAASQCQTGVYWTHNDSGDGPFIFAISETGANLGVWRVPSAENYDWEDIAAFRNKEGRCSLLIGDIGNNKEQRNYHTVYIVAEPKLEQSPATSRKGALLTEEPVRRSYKYPDGVENAEALMVDPISGSIFVITKSYTAPARLYKVGSVNASGDGIARLIGSITLPAIPPGTITGADISPDGKQLIVNDYGSGYEYKLDPNDEDLKSILSQTPERIDIGSRDTGEAVGYSADGGSIIATSEGIGSPIWITKRKK